MLRVLLICSLVEPVAGAILLCALSWRARFDRCLDDDWSSFLKFFLFLEPFGLDVDDPLVFLSLVKLHLSWYYNPSAYELINFLA